MAKLMMPGRGVRAVIAQRQFPLRSIKGAKTAEVARYIAQQGCSAPEAIEAVLEIKVR